MTPLERRLGIYVSPDHQAYPLSVYRRRRLVETIRYGLGLVAGGIVLVAFLVVLMALTLMLGSMTGAV